MPFKRFIETGRVALVSDGPNKGKLVSIIDVIDQTRVLVDGPNTGVPRGPIRLNQLHLTKLRLKFPFTASTRVVRKSWTASDVDKKWSESPWAQKLENKKKRAALTDYDRFKLRRARSTRNKIRSQAYFGLKSVASRNGSLYGKKSIPKKPRKVKAKKEKIPAKK